MVENHGGDDLLSTTDCLEAVGVFKGWKNFFFLIVLLCLLLLQACFYLVDRGCISVDSDVSASEPVGVNQTDQIPNAPPAEQAVAEPNEPGEPTGAAEPNVPVDSNEVVETDKPVRTPEPVETEGPNEPAKPNEAVDLAESVEPNLPAEPNAPAKLNEPAEPNVSAEPNEPVKPGESVDPNKPADPNETISSGPTLWRIDAKVRATTPEIQRAGNWFPKDFFSKITLSQLTWTIRLANAVLMLAATLYCLTLLFSLKVSLNGRLGGINHISRAFFLSLLMLVVLLPWQKAFGSILTGAMYTPDELVQWHLKKTDDVLNLALYYLRFSGYGALIILLLILSHLRCMRWARAILRRLDII